MYASLKQTANNTEEYETVMNLTLHTAEVHTEHR